MFEIYSFIFLIYKIKNIMEKEQIVNFINDNFDIACITAYDANNDTQNYYLKAVLLHYGYGVTKFDSNSIDYINDSDNNQSNETINMNMEYPFLVINLNHDINFKKNLFILSEHYKQNCFLYKPKGTKILYSINTNKTDNIQYKKETPIGNLNLNISTQFINNINTNTNKDNNNDIISLTNIINTTPNIKDKNKRQLRLLLRDALNMDLYEDYNYGARMAICNLSQMVNKEINKSS